MHHLYEMKNKKNYLLILAITSISFVPMLFSGFGLIDDHEIISLNEALSYRGIYGFINYWLGFEDFQETIRFRPTYILLRGIEALIFGTNFALWDFSRLIMCLVFGLGVYSIVDTLLDKRYAVILACISVAAPWSPYVFFKLGPAESYGLFFLGILLWVLASNLRNKYLYLVLISCLLVGVKESFLPFIFVGIWAEWKLIKDKSIRNVIIGGFFLLVGIVIILIVVYKIKLYSGGNDILNVPLGFERLSNLQSQVFKTKTGILALGVILISIFLLKRDNLLLMLFLIALVLFNIFIYSGIPSIYGKYAVPFWPGVIALLVLCLTKFNLRYKAAINIFWVLVAFLLLSSFKLSYGYLNNSTQMNRDYRSLSTTTNEQSEILISGTVDNYEQMMASIIFMKKYYKIDGVYFLNLIPIESNRETNFTKRLNNQLNTISLKGNEYFAPKSGAKFKNDDCYEIYFNSSYKPFCKKNVLIKDPNF